MVIVAGVGICTWGGMGGGYGWRLRVVPGASGWKVVAVFRHLFPSWGRWGWGDLRLSHFRGGIVESDRFCNIFGGVQDDFWKTSGFAFPRFGWMSAE